MRFRNLFRFIKHINKIGICSEKKRIAYSISHIVVMAISCVFAYFTYYLIANGNEIMSNHGFIVWLFSLFGIALSAFIAIMCFLQGFIAQIATIVYASIYVYKAEERSLNITALVISSVSFVAIIAATVILFVLL